MKSNGTTRGSRCRRTSKSSCRSRYEAIDSETSSSRRSRSRSWPRLNCAERSLSSCSTLSTATATCRATRPRKSSSSSPNANGRRLPNPIAPSGRTIVVSGKTQNDSTPIARISSWLFGNFVASSGLRTTSGRCVLNTSPLYD